MIPKLPAVVFLYDVLQGVPQGHNAEDREEAIYNPCDNLDEPGQKAAPVYCPGLDCIPLAL